MLCRWCTSSPPGGRSGLSRRCPWKRVPPSFTRTWQESLSRPHPPSKPFWSCSRPAVRIWASLPCSCCIECIILYYMHGIVHRASRLIECDAHLISKALWSVANLHHLLSDGAAFTTQSRSSLTKYAKAIADDMMCNLTISSILQKPN